MTFAEASPVDLLRYLPHRPPFLLVDRISECSPGSKIVGLKNVTASEPLLSRSRNGGGQTFGHLLAIEALAQLSVVLAYQTLQVEPSGSDLAFFAGIDRAEFGMPAVPGDVLLLESKVSRIKRAIGWFDGRVTVGGRQVVAVSMIASIRPKST